MRNLVIWMIVLAGCSSDTSVEPDVITAVGAVGTSASLAERTLAFASDRGGNPDIYTIRIDGGHLRNLTQHPGHDATPAWSPDGRWLAFVRGSLLMVMRANGSGLTQVASSVVGFPTWSPDGTRLAFMAFDPFPNLEIHVVNVDGTARQNITNHGARDEWPSWSPDGERIAFVSDRDGSRDIYSLRPDGSDPLQLTVTSDAHHLYPSWSRDGTAIVFVHALFSGGDGWGIFTMDPNGGNPRRIIGANAPATPAMSTDGSKIAFIDVRDGMQDLFLVNTDGTALTRLTNDAALDQHPTWR
ncbi:MAG: hypothetical protein ACREMA_08810 [Longimicrobiales bacterium]